MHEGIIFWILIGGVAGWLAGLLTRGGGFGMLMDVVLGIVGAFIGGKLAGALGIHVGAGWVSSLLTATAGAVLIVLVTRLVKR